MRTIATFATILVLMAGPARPQVPPPGPKPAAKAEGTPKAKAKAKGRAKAIDAPPVVMSSEAYAAMRGRPESTGRDKYGKADWDGLPPWKRASFFGIKAEGQLFVFVVDASGSMDDAGRLDRAKAELLRSVRAMQSPQRFKVIFYDDVPIPMPGELPKPADLPSKAQLARWLDIVGPGGGTDPRSSLAMAIGLRPDAVFLLSDGAFPPGTAEAVARSNPRKVPIHCVDLAGGAGGDDLRRIAADSGGQYAGRGGR